MSGYENAYAAMQSRVDATLAELNERLVDVLPDGIRFEWAPQPLTPRELWTEARGDRWMYRRLLAQHGYEPEPDVPDTWPRR